MKTLTSTFLLLAIWSYSYGQSPYFPVEKGTTQTYAYGSEMYAGTPYEDYTVKVRVLNDTQMIDGKEYLVSESAMGGKSGDPLVTTTYMRVGDDGTIYGKTDKEAAEEVFMKENPAVGDSFVSQSGGLTKVTDMSGSIETPTDAYSDCLVVESEENGMMLKSYFQKNVGLIATTMVDEGNEKIFFYLIED